jgi:hypothetical protein
VGAGAQAARAAATRAAIRAAKAASQPPRRLQPLRNGNVCTAPAEKKMAVMTMAAHSAPSVKALRARAERKHAAARRQHDVERGLRRPLLAATLEAADSSPLQAGMSTVESLRRGLPPPKGGADASRSIAAGEAARVARIGTFGDERRCSVADAAPATRDARAASPALDRRRRGGGVSRCATIAFADGCTFTPLRCTASCLARR